MSSYVELLLEKFRGKGLLIDANLLLLYFVGIFDLELIGDAKYKKLAKYTREDFSLLLRLKNAFSKNVTTPHILTEVSNLTGDLPEPTKVRCFQTFESAFVDTEEHQLVSLVVAKRPEFSYLGLTDTGIAELAQQYLVVSDDARMIHVLHRSGLSALNFNHLRDHLWR